MAGRLCLILAVLLRIYIEATENLSLNQIKALLQPRDANSRQFAPGAIPAILSPEQYEASVIKELSKIRERGLKRGQQGQRKYPMCYDEPVDNFQWWERRDNMYLNRFPKMVTDWNLSPDGPAQVLYNEIRGWKPSQNSVQQSRVDAYVSRLNEIRQRGLERGELGLNRFPKRRNDGSQESKDAMYIYGPSKYPEADHIWEEIHSWNEESSASKKHKQSKKRTPEEKQRVNAEFEDQENSDDSVHPLKRQTRLTSSAFTLSSAASGSSTISTSEYPSQIAPNLESPGESQYDAFSSDNELVSEDELQELIQHLPDEIIEPLGSDWDPFLNACAFDPNDLLHEEHIASSPSIKTFEHTLLIVLFIFTFFSCTFFFKQKDQSQENLYVEL